MSQFISQIPTFMLGAISVVITFGLAVFVHEFGHMFFALVRGVGVESFAIGMGPKICAWHWKGIEFSLRWFPIGGFVKLQGMVKEAPVAPAAEPQAATEPQDAAAASEAREEPGGTLTVHDVKVDDGQDKSDKSLTESSYDDLLALADKGFITKLMVFGGGVFMNFITAMFATALLLYIGQELPRYRMIVETVKPDSPAARAGLKNGDQITELNKKPVQFADEFDEVVENKAKEDGISLGKQPITLDMVVQREGQRVPVRIDQTLYDDFIRDVEVLHPPVVGYLAPHSPAEKAGIKVNDRIISINGAPVNSFVEMIKIVGPQLGKEVTLCVLRDGKQMDFKAVPSESIENPKRGAVGIFAGSEFKHMVREENPLKAIAKAPFATAALGVQLVKLQYEFFKKATFKQIRENLGGPIAIADLTQRKAREGFAPLLDWFIKFNLLLMMFNLLPIPVLDGGFILLAAIEGIVRRPVSPRVLQPIYTVFVIFFISLMVVISLLDIKRFLG